MLIIHIVIQQYWNDYYMTGSVPSIRDITPNKTKSCSCAERKERHTVNKQVSKCINKYDGKIQSKVREE